MRLHLPLLAILATAALCGSAAPAAAQTWQPSVTPQQAPPPAPGVAPNGPYGAPASPFAQPAYPPPEPGPYGPRYIKNWNEGEPVPYGYHEETRVRKGPIIAGAVLLGVTYLYTVFFASLTTDFENESGTGTNHSNDTSELYVPVLGPFMEVGKTGFQSVKDLLILDGVAQASGALMFLYGIVAQRAILVRNDVAMVTVTPMRLGKDGSGFGFVGRF